MIKPNSRIEPLIDSLKKISLGEFLISKDFKRYCIKIFLDEDWRNIYEIVVKNRTFLSLDIDHNKYDNIDTFIIFSNKIYEENSTRYFTFIQDLLFQYYSWSDGNIETKEIIEDLEILNCPEVIINNISVLKYQNSKAVPNSKIPEKIINSEKLERAIKEMEESIKQEKYNLTLTYAYSSLEGLFKGFIEKRIPIHKNETDLSKISKIVKDFIKKDFKEKGQEYPEQMINLISTITNGVSNARNSFSESHFNHNSDKWLAEFVKDCVNSVGRLIIGLIK